MALKYENGKYTYINLNEYKKWQEEVEELSTLLRGKQDGAREAVVHRLEESLGDWDKRFLVSALIQLVREYSIKEAEPALLNALESNLFYIKADAAKALGKVADSQESVEKLKDTLEGTHSKQVKEGAIKGLADIQGDEVVEPLADVAQNETKTPIKEKAVKALGDSHAEEAIMPLIDYFYSVHDERLRVDVIEALSKIASISSEEFLMQTLSNPNPDIRSCAAMSLGHLRSDLAKASLNNLLTDSHEAVRNAAAKALGLITFLPKK